MTMAAPTSLRTKTTSTQSRGNSSMGGTMTPISNNNNNQILKFSVLYTSKIHNKNPANQDGVLFYHTQNWRLRLFECDRHGNMGMEIALDFRKMNHHLEEGEVFILAGKYRVMVDSLLSTEIVKVGLPPPPPSAAAVEGAVATTVSRQRQRDNDDGDKRKRAGLRPGELAHGQTDRALKDVIREQNENMRQQRRQQRRADNRQWTTTLSTTRSSSSSIGSWQQQLQQLMLQQQKEPQKPHQNHSQQEQRPPRKKPNHSQSRDKNLILSTTQSLPQQDHLHHEAPQQTLPRSNHRSAGSVNTAAIAMLDAVLDDDQDDAMFFSDLDDIPDLSSDEEIQVVDVTHPGNKPSKQGQLNVVTQNVAPIRLSTAINPNSELPIPINDQSFKKSQSPKKLAAKSPTKTATAVMKSVFSTSNKPSMTTSPTSLRPPSFANSNFSNGAFGGIPNGGGLRCLQGMLSRTPMSRLPPTASVFGTSIIDRKDRQAKSANDNDDETEDFRTISTKIFADLNQVETNLNLSTQNNSINVINNKEKVCKTFKNEVKNNNVTEVKLGEDKTVELEINTSPTRASKSTMTTTLDYSDKIIDDIDMFSDSDPVFTAEPVLSVDNLTDKSGQHAVGSNTTPALPQQQNSLQKIKSDNKDEFDDYDFSDDADIDIDLLSSAHPKTIPDIEPVTAAATKVGGNEIEMMVTKDEPSINSKDVKMAGNPGELFDSQQESDIPDDFFEDDDKSNNNNLSSGSPSLAAATKILHSSTGEYNINGDDNVVMTEDHRVLSTDAETSSSIVEIQLLSLPSQLASSAAVSNIEGTSGSKSPGHDGRDDANLAAISSCAIHVSTTNNIINSALLDVVSLTNKNTTTSLLDTTNINTNNTANKNDSFSQSLSCELSSPHNSKPLFSAPHADLQHKTEPTLPFASNSATISKLSSSPVSVTKKTTATTVPEATASYTSTSVQSSPPVLLHTGFGRPRKRAMFGIGSDSVATGLTTTPSTNNVITTATAVDSVIVNRNNPQFVPPVSKAHLQQQQQQQQQRVYTTTNNRSNTTGSSTSNINNSDNLVPQIEPAVLVAEEYGAWTAETMDLFSWRPAQ